MKKLGVLMALLCLGLGLSAQYAEVGLTLGTSYYIGDLNPYKHYPKNTSVAGGAVFRYNFDRRYALKANVLYGSLEAYDADSKFETHVQRNLHFRSSLLEIGAQLEINFFEYSIGDKKHWITPYLFAGIAFYRFNPKAKLDDTWYELQPLGTEGQGTSLGGDLYGTSQLSLPFGAGLKMSIGNRLGMALEWGLRKTFSDHIDDVGGYYVDNDLLAFENGPLSAELADRSLPTDGTTALDNTGVQRGNPENTDWYVYSGIMLTYKLGSKFEECDRIIKRMGR